MRVVCDNCGATYKIPDHKLSREVNKATCRKCGHTIIIRRPGAGAATVSSQPPGVVKDEGESTAISSEADLRARALAGSPQPSDEYVPPTVVKGQAPDHGDQTMPRADLRPPTPRAPAPAVAPRPPSQAPSMAPAPSAPVQGVPLPQPPAFDPSGDLTLVMAGCFAAVVGAGVMAANMGAMATLVGLGLTLTASITSLMVLITGDRGRKAASVMLSMGLGVLLAGGAAAGVWFTGLLADEPVDPEPAVAEVEPQGPKYPTMAPPENPPPEEQPEAVVADAQTPPPKVETPREEPKVDLSTDRFNEPDPAPPKEERTTSTSTARTNTTVTPTVTPKVEPKAAPKSSGNVGVPVTVLDTMLKSNKGVKTCFGKYRQETGSLPSGRITVRITVQPSGKATSANIAGGAYQNSSLDTCLSGAIKTIQFPPWDGSESATYNYPFIL